MSIELLLYILQENTMSFLPFLLLAICRYFEIYKQILSENCLKWNLKRIFQIYFLGTVRYLCNDSTFTNFRYNFFYKLL